MNTVINLNIKRLIKSGSKVVHVRKISVESYNRLKAAGYLVVFV